VQEITTVGVAIQASTVDPLGRADSNSLLLSAFPRQVLTLGITYDPEADRIAGFQYRDTYGQSPQLLHVTQAQFGMAGRPTAVNVDGLPHISEIAYNAAGQPTYARVGTSRQSLIEEKYSYSPDTLRLIHQMVQQNGIARLDLSYGYLRSGTAGGQAN
jgi:hypothetical protein